MTHIREKTSLSLSTQSAAYWRSIQGLPHCPSHPSVPPVSYYISGCSIRIGFTSSVIRCDSTGPQWRFLLTTTKLELRVLEGPTTMNRPWHVIPTGFSGTRYIDIVVEECDLNGSGNLSWVYLFIVYETFCPLYT